MNKQKLPRGWSRFIAMVMSTGIFGRPTNDIPRISGEHNTLINASETENHLPPKQSDNEPVSNFENFKFQNIGFQIRGKGSIEISRTDQTAFSGIGGVFTRKYTDISIEVRKLEGKKLLILYNNNGVKEYQILISDSDASILRSLL